MSYPNVIYGDYGDEKVTASAKIGNLPLGQLMILPDGRKFRHAQAGGSNLGAGVIVSTSAGLAGDGNVASSGLIASATTSRNLSTHTDVYVATSKLAYTEDQFADGILNVQGPAASTYIGHIYRIKANDAAASVAAGGDLHIELWPSDGLKVAFKAGTTTVSVRKSPYKDAIVYDSSTVIAGPMGVTPVAVSTTYYFWVQKSGPASVEQGGTAAIDGEAVYCATCEAGSATEQPDTSDTSTIVAAYNLHIKQRQIGFAMEGAVASEAVLVDLDLE